MKESSRTDFIRTEQSRSLIGVALQDDEQNLTKTQLAFNRWIGRIARQRETLAKWTAFQARYQGRLAAEMQPLERRLRDKRVALAVLLDKALIANAGEALSSALDKSGASEQRGAPRKRRVVSKHSSLNKRERTAAVRAMLELIRKLLEDGHNTVLVEIHDRYSATSYAEFQREEAELIDRLARAMYGDDFSFDDDDPIESRAARRAGRAAEKDARADADQDCGANPDAESGDEDLRPDPPGLNRRARRQSDKARAREAAKAQAAVEATRSIRDIFRKLVSRLHPDRERDADERARKTLLMQRVNQAYRKRDLLSLLELQLEVAHIAPGSMTQLPDVRLAPYIELLKDQSVQLQRAIDRLVVPFQRSLGLSARRRPSRAMIDAALDGDVAQLAGTVADLERDLVAFVDVSNLKAGLRHTSSGYWRDP